MHGMYNKGPILKDNQLNNAIPPIKLSKETKKEIDNLGNFALPNQIQTIPIHIFNIIDHFIDHDSSHALEWLYLFITIAFIYAILMGSFWDSSHIASTFFVYIVFLPAFMIDEPSMHIAGALIWTLIFMLCSYFAKMPDHPQYFKMDLQGAIMFGLTSLMVNQFI
jgi:hypothetical protein